MVGDAAEGLQDDEGPAAFPGSLDDLGRDQDALAGIIGARNDGVAGLGDVSQLGRRFKQGVLFCNGGDKVVGGIEDLFYQIEIASLHDGFFDAVVLCLLAADKVGLLDDIRHLGLDDLKAVFLQIRLDIVVGARVEIEQVLSDDQDRRPGIGAVIGHLLHQADGLFKALLHLSDTAVFNGIHQHIQGFLKGFVGNPLHSLIGAHLAQQILQRIDHGKGKGDLDRGLKIELESGVKVVIVDVIIGDDRHIRVSGIIQGLAEQGSVVGEPAAADVLAHHDGFFHPLVLRVFEGL